MSTTPETLASVAERNWTTLGVRGVLAVLFGVLAFVWPGITLVALVMLFGAYAVVDGLFAFGGAYRAAENSQSVWPFLLEGLLGVVAGLAAFVWTDITAAVLVYLIAAWAIVTGAVEVYSAFQLRKEITDELWLGAGGVVSILFGLLVVAMPSSGALAVVWLIAAYAVVFGLTLLGLAWRMRGEDSTTGAGGTGLSA